MDSTAQHAIDAALQGNWIVARRLNEEVLYNEPKNLAALNRLARALVELGKFKKATAVYKKVLKLDAYNSIAQKAVFRIKKLESNGSGNKTNTPPTSPPPNASLFNFLEEPGKTKTACLIHPGDSITTLSLGSGQQVMLVPSAHRVCVETMNGQYVGRLTDDLSHLLIKLIRAGNIYQSIIRSVNKDTIKIFIREVKRANELSGQPSFPLTERLGYVSFTSPDSIHDGPPDVSTTEEQEEKI